MNHIAYVERQDYFEVFIDYSGSPRIAEMTDEQWANEYATDDSYASFRITYPGSVAGVKPQSVGLWTKDWSEEYRPPRYVLRATSDKPAGPDGVPEAQGDGVGVHTITICKKNYWTGETVSGSEVVRALPDQMVAVNPRMVQLVDGVGRISVGPSAMPGEISLAFRDQAGVLEAENLRLRFL